MPVKRISYPVKKKPKGKGGAPFGNRNHEYPAEIRMTQFALEQALEKIERLESQTDALGKLDKQKDITINLLTTRVKRLEERMYRRDSE